MKKSGPDAIRARGGDRRNPGLFGHGLRCRLLQGVTVAVMEDARLPSLVTVVNPLGVDTLTVVG
jgi:hypothetical protein